MSDSGLIQDFQEKSKEVKQYCLWLKNVESKMIQLSIGDHSANRNKIKSLDSELEKTLKATVFLLLYNLVESTIRSAVEYIYDDLKNNQTSFDDLNQSFQNHIIKILKNSSLKDKAWKPTIALTLITISADIDLSFAGNLDAKKIKETLKNYGITLTKQVGNMTNGEDLLIVKNARKDLAHGHSSFSEKSRNYTSGDLLAMQKRVTLFLKQVLIDVQNYVDQQKYLK
jgi:hypothetical protein